MAEDQLKLNKIVISNIRGFKGEHEFNFEDSKLINTVSGKNGSGKSTIFECVSICQKAYYFKKYFDSNLESPRRRDYECIIRKDIDNLKSGKESTISLYLSLGTERVLKLTIQIADDWKLCISEDDDSLLKSFWNTKNPTNVIVLLDAEKMVVEEDFLFQKINMVGDDRGSIIDFIMEPKKTYQNMYNIMINKYVYNRLVPSDAAKRKDKFTVDSIDVFNDIMKDHGISITKFSGQYKAHQFILCAKKNGTFDMRQMSSGEKLIWYILLIFNYVKNISILIIDEPENHLHEQLSWSFVKYMKRINENNAEGISIRQIVLLTHAKNLIYNNFASGTNYVLDNEHKLQKIEFENCEEILRSCGISYIYDRVLYVEGKTEIHLFQDFCSENNIKIQELTNCDEIIRTYESLIKVKDLVYVPRFVFLIDKDTRTSSDIEDIKNKDNDFFDKHFIVLQHHEIENLFLDENIIFREFNEIQKVLEPNSEVLLSEQDVYALMKQIADESRPNTKQKYLNLKLDGEIKQLSNLVSQKAIQSNTSEEYKNYIDRIFNSDKFEYRVCQMKTLYDSAENYFKEWDNKWKYLCDGKIVFNKTLNELRSKYCKSMPVSSLKERVVNHVKEINSSPFGEVLKLLEKKFQ